MIAAVLEPIIRRAVLDLVEDTGGEINDEMITILLNELGHRVARSDVRLVMAWCDGYGLLKTEKLGPYIVARSTSEGRDVANGLQRVEGVSRHKTGE